eukprot:gene1230-32572_t
MGGSCSRNLPVATSVAEPEDTTGSASKAQKVAADRSVHDRAGGGTKESGPNARLSKEERQQAEEGGEVSLGSKSEPGHSEACNKAEKLGGEGEEEEEDDDEHMEIEAGGAVGTIDEGGEHLEGGGEATDPDSEFPTIGCTHHLDGEANGAVRNASFSTSATITVPPTPCEADMSRDPPSTATSDATYGSLPNSEPTTSKQQWQQALVLPPLDSKVSSILASQSGELGSWQPKPALPSLLQPLSHPVTFHNQGPPPTTRHLKVVKPKYTGPLAASGIYGRAPHSRPALPPHFKPQSKNYLTPKQIDAAASASASAAMRRAMVSGELESHDSIASSQAGSVLGQEPPSDSFDLSASLPASRFGSNRQSRVFADQDLLDNEADMTNDLMDNEADMMDVASRLKQGLPPSRGSSVGSSGGCKPCSSHSHRAGLHSKFSNSGVSAFSLQVLEEEEDLLAFSRDNLGPSRFAVLSTVAEDPAVPPRALSPPVRKSPSPLSPSHVYEQSRFGKVAGAGDAGGFGSGKAQVLTVD